MISKQDVASARYRQTLGVRSACLNTVTLAFNNHVGASWLGFWVNGKGLSIDEDTRMHRAAKMSAALSDDKIDI